MTYRGPLARAVATAIAAGADDKRDVGAVALARRYAELIDAASPASKYREPLAQLGRAVALLDVDDATPYERALTKITDALAAHSVASDLGPKLLAALSALGLTPAARGDGKGGTAGEPAANPLDELRARRAARTDRTATVDTAAP